MQNSDTRRNPFRRRSVEQSYFEDSLNSSRANQSQDSRFDRLNSAFILDNSSLSLDTQLSVSNFNKLSVIPQISQYETEPFNIQHQNVPQQQQIDKPSQDQDKECKVSQENQSNSVSEKMSFYIPEQQNSKQQPGQKKQKFKYIAKKYGMQFFNFVPKNYPQQLILQLKQIEKQLYEARFYSQQYVEMRSLCIKRANAKFQQLIVKLQKKSSFKQLFIKEWQEIMKQEKQKQKLSDKVFFKKFYICGEHCFKLVQMDIIKLFFYDQLHNLRKNIGRITSFGFTGEKNHKKLQKQQSQPPIYQTTDKKIRNKEQINTDSYVPNLKTKDQYYPAHEI